MIHEGPIATERFVLDTIAKYLNVTSDQVNDDREELEKCFRQVMETDKVIAGSVQDLRERHQHLCTMVEQLTKGLSGLTGAVESAIRRIDRLERRRGDE